MMEDLEAALSYRLGASPRCTRLFRAALGAVVACEIADKWPTLEWLYSDAGALPRSAALPEPAGEGRWVWVVCAHAWHGSLAWAQLLSLAQLGSAAALAADWHPVTGSLVCWWLHCSWCLRNASLVYILDRYLHLLLLYSAFFPAAPARVSARVPRASAAACILAVQLLVVYADAGLAKYADPQRTWSLFAPVAALDTYLRHTPVARAARALLGAAGLPNDLGVSPV